MAKGKILVKDTANVYYHFANGDTRFIGCMNSAGLEKTLDSEDIRCGIGWGIGGILYSNPDMKLTFTPAFWNDYFVEDASGSEFINGSEDIWTHEDVTFTASSSDAICTITGTPLNDVVKVQDANGKMYSATYSAGTVTVTGGASLDGTAGVVSYEESVTGDILEFKSTAIPKVHGITLETIAYDPDSNEIVSKLYFKFNKVVGDGALSLAIAGGTNSITEITARVLPDSNGLFGKYITVDA